MLPISSVASTSFQFPMWLCPVSPMSIFNTNAARADERFSVGVKCRNQPVADGKPVVIFFFLFILLAFENPNQ